MPKPWQVRKYHGEGRIGDVALIAVEQVGVVVGDQRADDEDRTDVEQQDAPENGLDRLGHAPDRVGRFRRSQADAFGTLEGEPGEQEHQQHGGQATDEGRVRGGRWIMQRPVVQTAVIADYTDDHQHAHREEDDHRDHLDAREPVFRLGVGPDRQQVQCEQHGEETHDPGGGVRIREPVLHDQRAGHQFGRQRNHPAEPVVPADGKAHRRVDETFGVGFE